MRSPEGFELDLQAQALLWMMRQALRQETADIDLVAARRSFERHSPLFGVRNVPDIFVQDGAVPGAAGDRRIRAYIPAALRGLVAPALVWFHGGGYALGSIESHDGLCRALAHKARVVVVSVDYRLAPEHPFPAGIDDAVHVTRWILGHADRFGVDARAIAVGGDSSGGAFAAVVAQTLRGEKRVPALQFLAYPGTDARYETPSRRHFASGFILSARAIAWYLDQYVSDRSLAHDSRASPLAAADLSGLPPALVVTAGFDPLRDEGLAYAHRLRGAGVPVESTCSTGSLHGFLSTAGVIREAARVLDYVTSRIGSALWPLLRPQAAPARVGPMGADLSDLLTLTKRGACGRGSGRS